LGIQNCFQTTFLVKSDIVFVPKRKYRKNHQKSWDYSVIYPHYCIENTNFGHPSQESITLSHTDSKFYPIIVQKVV
jgi:hypothetical protein